MPDKNYLSEKFGLQADKRLMDVKVTMIDGRIIRGQAKIEVSGRLSDWLDRSEDFILLLNASGDDQSVQKTRIINRDQIQWITSDSEWPTTDVHSS